MMSLIILFSSLAGFTADIPAPPYNCDYREYGCPTEMKRIADEFKYGTPLDHQIIPQVYSGVCYHHSTLYDPSYPHHGVMLIAEKNMELYFGGSFAFFANENPYANWTVDVAMKELSARLFRENHKIFFGQRSDFIRIHEPKSPDEELIYYWLRQNSITKKVILMGFMGVKNGVFCEYDANQ